MKKYTGKAVSVFLAIIMFLSIGILKPINAFAEAVEGIPQIASVSLEQESFFEGQDNSLIISSEGYEGKVQYQIFYNCTEKMENHWNLIYDSKMIKGWTSPVNTKEEMKINLSGLDLKKGDYKFAVRVKRADKNGKYNTVYGEYDDAYGFCFKVEKPQVINVNLKGNPRTLDSNGAYDINSKKVLNQIMEGLTRVEFDEKGKEIVKPAGADSWECNEEGTEWTFHLRDFYWEDGKKVTAEDYAYGILRMLSPDTQGAGYWLLTPIIKNAKAYSMAECDVSSVGIKVIDSKTLKFTLESPCTYFLQLTYFNVMYPQRADIIEKYGYEYGTEKEKFIGCGPFVLEKWEENEEIVLKKSTTYWDKDSVKLNKINMKIVMDDDETLEKLSNGELDICDVYNEESRDKLEKTNMFNSIEIYNGGISFVQFNQKDKYFSNDKIRKAFIIAQDRETEAKIHNKIYEPAYAFCPPFIQIDGEYYRNTAKEGPIKRLMEENQDPKELLIEGLKEIGEDTDPSKMEIKMLVVDYAASKKLAEKAKKSYKDKLGVNIELDTVEFALKFEKISELDYQITNGGWIGDYNDPVNYLEIWKTGNKIFASGWTNKEYDELIEKAAKSMEPKERLETYKKAENILLYEDSVISPRAFLKSQIYVRKSIKNIMKPVFGIVDFKYAYIED